MGSDNQHCLTRRTVVLSLVLLVCLSGECLAQGKPQLFSRIELTLKEKEAVWRIKQVLGGGTFDPLSESIVLRAGKKDAAIEISIWNRLQDAQGAFAGEVIAFDNTRGKRAIKTSLPNLGDENYMWTNPRSDAWPMIYIRKGNIDYTVFAPSAPLAKRFAQRVIEEIDKTR